MADVTWERVVRGGSFRLGWALGIGAVATVALLSIPVATTWNSRGGEQAWNALVLGSAAVVAIRGVVVARGRVLRRRGVGLVVGAVLGVAVVYAAFLFYFLGLHGT